MTHHLRLFPLSLVLVVLWGVTSCNLNIPTENELTDPQILTSVQGGYEALSTAYATFPTEHFLLSLLADDYAPLSYARMVPELQNTYQWVPYELEKHAGRLWDGYYKCIININAVLTRLDALKGVVPDTDKPAIDRVQAEAETLKALCYIDLLQIFATRYTDTAHPEGILLKDHVEAEQRPRSSKAECVCEIQRLLSSAKALFTSTSGLTPLHGGHTSFVSMGANTLALARLALYTEDYKAAEHYAREVLEIHPVTTKTVSPAVSDWAHPPKRSVILALANTGSFYTETFVSSRRLSECTYMLNPSAGIASGDIRHSVYAIDSILPISGTHRSEIQLLGKFNRPNLSNIEITQIPIMRPVEALFILAESQIRQGAEDQARGTMNAYLSLVHSSAIPSSIGGRELLSRIMEEKQKEFAGENVRYFDLKRLRVARETLGVNAMHQNIIVTAEDYRWTLPIPRSEYRTNHSLERQNPGWREFQRIKTE